MPGFRPALAANSANGGVAADLVDVGVASRAEDYAGVDVKGRIVLGSACAGVLQRLAVFERGAAGVVSYSSLRPDDYPDQIPSSGEFEPLPLGEVMATLRAMEKSGAIVLSVKQ